MDNKKKTIILLLVIMLLCQAVLCGCQGAESKEILIGADNPPEPCDMGEDFSRYSGRRIGVTSGTVQEKYLSAKIEGAVPAYYENFADMAVALLQGKIDAYEDISEAFNYCVKTRGDKTVIVAGSLYLVGEIKGLIF